MDSERQTLATQRTSNARTESYFSVRSFATSAESTSSAVYYPASTNLKVDSAPGPPTYIKWHRDKYQEVYRSPNPKHGHVTREYVLEHLPKLNLTSSISTIGSGPMATNGGFANVYMGELDRNHVAIKVMRTSLRKEDLEKVERASLRELFAWSQLTHKNILDLLGYTFNYPPCVAFVSPWQVNGNATDYLQRKDLGIVRKVLGGAVKGLKYLHEKNIVHGDFRGNNILISKEQEALVADFGLARILELAGLSSKSPPGGNIRWMAPELFGDVAEEDKDCAHSKESDMWSLGMTILELCSSQKPYHNILRDHAVLVKLLQDCLPNRHPAVPDFLWNICSELWTVPSDRPTVEDACVLLSIERSASFGRADEIMLELLNSGTSKVATLVGREVSLSSIFNTSRWISSLPRVLNRARASGGGAFGATLFSHFIQHGIISIDSIDDCGRTPLHLVAQFPNNQSLSSITALVNHPGANLNATDQDGLTPLHYAVIHGHNDMVNVLLDQPDVNVNPKDINEWTPLWYAIIEPYRDDTARSLLLHPTIDVGATDSGGQTLLHHAVRESRRDNIQILLEHKEIEVNAKDSAGRTPLSYSVSRYSGSYIEEILENANVDINSVDILGRTPLHYAVIEHLSYASVPVLLRSKNIDANVKDCYGRTALSYAAQYSGFCDDTLVVYLLGHSTIDVNSVDSEGKTPLHHAILAKNHHAASLLLRFPTIHVRVKDHKGRTALSYAAEIWGDSQADEFMQMWQDSQPDEWFFESRELTSADVTVVAG